MLNLNKITQLRSIQYVSSVFQTKRLALASNLSTKVATVETLKDEKTELQTTVEKISKITPKEIKKKPQKPPFVKNLLLGVFDTDLLAYPEVLEKEHVEKLENDIVPIKNFYDSISRDNDKEITKNYLENLNNLKLLGLQVPSFDGGRQLSTIETCCFYEEIAKAEGKIGIIHSEQLGINTLLKYRSELHSSVKECLDELITGKTVAAFCLNDSSDKTNKLKAVESSDRKYFILNGKKKWIVNGDSADVFIVLCETSFLNKDGLMEDNTSALLVRRNYGGITTKPVEMNGLKLTDIAEVSFENTPIPMKNFIGDIHLGNKVITTIMHEFRLSSASVSSTILRKVIQEFIKHSVSSNALTGTLADTEVVQSLVGELVCNLYSIESLNYFTASLMDGYENQDCEIEAAITKAFSVERCSDSILKVMKFIGTPALAEDSVYNKLYRDSTTFMLLYESLDSLKLIISLLGLRYAGMKLNDKVKQHRNPYFYPVEMWKRMWNQRKHNEDNPPLTLGLHQYVHPSLFGQAQQLEYCVLRLQFATELLLVKFGPDVIGKHVELDRLAQCIIDIYAMVASLTRASRSYCIGLPHAAKEIDLASVICYEGTARVKRNMNIVIQGYYNNVDVNNLNIGKYAIDHKEYFPVNPLTRNY